MTGSCHSDGDALVARTPGRLWLPLKVSWSSGLFAGILLRRAWPLAWVACRRVDHGRPNAKSTSSPDMSAHARGGTPVSRVNFIQVVVSG